ncbi:MAG: hypothetical protein LBT55_04475 [Clostridiaceae bacterium]|jgi:hypothetical protein|nr:hypothetical protein [Clostridiaceae bacterium]
MKKSIKNLLLPLFITTAAFACYFGSAIGNASVCSAADNPATETSSTAASATEPVIKEIYDLITPEYIGFYETYIAKAPVITSISPRKLARLAENYNVSENKVRAVLACQNLMSLNGERKSVSELMRLPEKDFIKLVSKQTQAYINRLSEEEKITLNAEFKKLKKPLSA